MEQSFLNVVPEFCRYMQSENTVNAHSRTNYLSWLRFLSQSHRIDGMLSDEDIESILEEERLLLGTRAKYNSTKDLTNFRSALRMYMKFARSGFIASQEQKDQTAIDNVEQANNITVTERQQLMSARVGQGVFRERLIRYWHSCAITHCTKTDLLMASHIKPWRTSDNEERLDVFNGLLLLPNFDKLFDKGYITFSESGRIKMSSFISPEQYQLLGVSSECRLTRIDDRHLPYLEYHRNKCFIGI